MTEKKERAKQVETRAVDSTRDRPVARPDTDIYETDEAFVVVADMPGLDQSAVSVEYRDDVLTIRGQAPAPAAEKSSEPDYQEFCVRDFERSFAIGAKIDAEKITARMKNGTLRVTLPLAPEVRPRQIQVAGE